MKRTRHKKGMKKPEPEKLNVQLKFFVTSSLKAKIEAEVKPGRNMSDIARDALEAYFAAKESAAKPPEK